jgi:hypothetical protein
VPKLRTEFEGARGISEKSISKLLRANDDLFIGEGVMLKWDGMARDGADEAILRVREQDEAFCRILRAAIEHGRESCPIGVSTEPGTKKPTVMRHKRPDSYY